MASPITFVQILSVITVALVVGTFVAMYMQISNVSELENQVTRLETEIVTLKTEILDLKEQLIVSEEVIQEQRANITATD